MRTITRLFALLFAALHLAIAAPNSSAADSSPPATDTSTTAKAAQVATKDAFLQMLLEKAQKYTAAGERAVEKAVDTVAEEAPLALAEFLRWRAWMHGLKALLPLILSLGGIALFSWQWGKWETRGEYLSKGSVGNVVATILGGVIGLISTIGLMVVGFSNFLSLVQVLVAPRIYVIEQVIGALK